MKRLRILCSKKEPIIGGEIAITHIGGVNGMGERWNIPVEQAVKNLRFGDCGFFVVKEFREYEVAAVADEAHRLSIPGSNGSGDLLVELPDCP